MDGLQYQWLLDPESVDMPGAFRDFLTLLGENPPPGSLSGSPSDSPPGEG